ncbi:hypothetical protein ACF0H5_022706 [Mactra antiquata]
MMDISEKTPLNAIKQFCNEHPCTIFWHNGTTDDACKVNGFHMHIIVYNKGNLWHDSSWRTCRKKLTNANVTVRVQKVKSLPAILNHLQQSPRILVGCNNVKLCAALIRYKDYKADYDIADQFQGDEHVSESAADDNGQSSFLSDMMGWKEQSAVSNDDDNDSDHEISISDYIMNLAQKPDSPTTSFEDICRDKKPKDPKEKDESKKMLPATKGLQKMDVLRSLISKYDRHTQHELLTSIIKAGDKDDLTNWRTLKCSPQFVLVWNQVIAEIAAEKVSTGTTYCDTLLTADIDTDESYLTVAETAQLFMEWCEHQRINPGQFLGRLYQVLNCTLPKVNTFTLVGTSNAGKSYWMNAIACLKDHFGETISSADFMWQECVDKQLIYIPECTISKPDQLEIFKKVCEGMPTMVNIKNKPAAMLKRAPVLLTSNTLPWEYFQQEREAIENRMFFERVKQAPMLKEKGAANPKMFIEIFKFIREYTLTDNDWPYAEDTENWQTLQDSIEITLQNIMTQAPETGVDFEDDLEEHMKINTVVGSLLKRTATFIQQCCIDRNSRRYLGLEIQQKGTKVSLKKPELKETMTMKELNKYNKVFLDCQLLKTAIAHWPDVKTDGMIPDLIRKLNWKNIVVGIEQFISSQIGKAESSDSDDDVVLKPAPLTWAPSKKRELESKVSTSTKRTKLSVKFDESDCFGCQNDKPSQKAHMGHGGCLEEKLDLGDLDCPTETEDN